MSVVNEPATAEACAKDYASRAAASPSPTVRAEAANPGRITGTTGIPPQQGAAKR